MPFINLKTNVVIKDKESLKAKLGQVISVIPGKTEPMTMVCLNDKQDLYMGGSDAPCIIVETLVNGGSDHSKDLDYTKALILMVSEELNVPKNRVYALVHEELFWYAMLK